MIHLSDVRLLNCFHWTMLSRFVCVRESKVMLKYRGNRRKCLPSACCTRSDCSIIIMTVYARHPLIEIVITCIKMTKINLFHEHLFTPS